MIWGSSFRRAWKNGSLVVYKGPYRSDNHTYVMTLLLLLSSKQPFFMCITAYRQRLISTSAFTVISYLSFSFNTTLFRVFGRLGTIIGTFQRDSSCEGLRKHVFHLEVAFRAHALFPPKALAHVAISTIPHLNPDPLLLAVNFA